MTWLWLGVALLAIGQAGLWASLYVLVRRVDRIDGFEPQRCAHADVKNIGTFGHPEYQCTLCHQVIGP